MDGEAGEGVELARRFVAHGYPTFLLLRSDGTLTDRWTGYHAPQEVAAILRGAAADPSPADEQLRRWPAAATASDAARLARLHLSRGEHREARQVLLEAQRRDPSRAAETAYLLFDATVRGHFRGDFDASQVTAAAESALRAGQLAASQYLDMAKAMQRVAREAADPRAAAPYVEAALAASAGVGDRGLWRRRQELLVEQALRVEDDAAKALTLRRAMLDGVGRDDPLELNEFAWWCFTNGMALAEAEAAARRGVERAPPGPPRAMVLDTLAEIRFARGDAAEAVSLVEAALREQPGDPYLTGQLQRFREARPAAPP